MSGGHATKPNAGKPCERRDYFAKEESARMAFRAQHGGWRPVPCGHCGGWHLERARRRST